MDWPIKVSLVTVGHRKTAVATHAFPSLTGLGPPEARITSGDLVEGLEGLRQKERERPRALANRGSLPMPLGANLALAKPFCLSQREAEPFAPT